MKLTNYFIKKKVQTLASETINRKRQFCTLSEAQQILILFRADDHTLVEPSLRKLQSLHKQVTSCVYVAGETTSQLQKSSIVIQTEKDLDAWYKPTEEACKRFMEIKADILIDLTGKDCYAMQYLVLKHPCAFKVGMHQEGADLYDLSILMTDSDDIKLLFEHILFYLQAIRSK